MSNNLRKLISNRNWFCRSCGAKIQWAITEKGRRMPVDHQPSAQGNILLHHRSELEPLAVYLTPTQVAALAGTLQSHRLYVSHFATCRDALKWRRKKQ